MLGVLEIEGICPLFLPALSAEVYFTENISEVPR
jgi:hypothetical protein